MPPNPDSAIHSALRRIGPLQDLGEAELAAVARDIRLLQAPAGSLLIDIGYSDPRQLFLVAGEAQLVAQDGASHLVAAADPAARGPISRLRPSRYRVTARSPVTYVFIDQSVLEQTTARQGVIVEETFAVSAPNQLSDDDSHPLLFDVFTDINAGTVVAPSYSDVAVRVGRALHRSEQHTSRFIDTLASCPALTLKTMRAARSASSSHQMPRSVRVAVERYGIDQTYALAVSCVLRETFRSSSDAANDAMRSWWERSIRAAAICRELARDRERLDADYAMLIGLLQGIADPVMLGYADRHPDLADPLLLDQVLRSNRAELSRILLTMWSMPRELIDAAARTAHWQYNHGGDADYTDLVLIAQWFAFGGNEGAAGLPPLDEMPSAYRLGLSTAADKKQRLVEADRGALERTRQLLAE